LKKDLAISISLHITKNEEHEVFLCRAFRALRVFVMYKRD